jgi:hypothetical protein
MAREATAALIRRRLNLHLVWGDHALTKIRGPGLQPTAASPAPIKSVRPLRHDALKGELAPLGEQDRALGGERLAEAGDKPHQRLPPGLERTRTQIARSRPERPYPIASSAPAPPRSPAFPASAKGLRGRAQGPRKRPRDGRSIGRAWPARAPRAVRSCGSPAHARRRWRTGRLLLLGPRSKRDRV